MHAEFQPQPELTVGGTDTMLRDHTATQLRGNTDPIRFMGLKQAIMGLLQARK